MDKKRLIEQKKKVEVIDKKIQVIYQEKCNLSTTKNASHQQKKICQSLNQKKAKTKAVCQRPKNTSLRPKNASHRPQKMQVTNKKKYASH